MFSSSSSEPNGSVNCRRVISIGRCCVCCTLGGDLLYGKLVFHFLTTKKNCARIPSDYTRCFSRILGNNRNIEIDSSSARVFLRTFSLEEYFSLVGDNTLPRMLFELANMISLTSFTLDGDLSLLHWSWSWLSVFRLKCSLFFNESMQISSFLLSNGFELWEWIVIFNLAPLINVLGMCFGLAVWQII